MHRSLLPFTLASLGHVIVLLAIYIPLFEWQISGIVTDFPPTYDVHISSHPLTTILGEALSTDSYLGKVYVSKDEAICRDCYSGTVTFNVALSKVHYEMPILLFAGILLELGALGIMVRQIIKAIIERITN